LVRWRVGSCFTAPNATLRDLYPIVEDEAEASSESD
jgi:hypothetical protein